MTSATVDMEAISISAKNLGALALPDRCDRCWWVKQKLKLPYQIFPGVFSTIDSFSKRLTHTYIDSFHQTPPWLAPLGQNIRPLAVPHWSKFTIRDDESQLSVRGMPDEMFELEDGTTAIVDYKTAVLTGGQDALMPLYKTQLGAYGFIAERLGFGALSRLLLVYFQPNNVVEPDSLLAIHSSGIPAMQFTTATLEVDVAVLASVPRLLREARVLLDQVDPPAGRPNCKDCFRLNGLIDSLAATVCI